ncbi:MAG: hypothetical protein ACOYB2_04565 [Limnohabitans sp.]
MTADPLTPPTAKMYSLTVSGIPCLTDSTELMGAAFKEDIAALPWAPACVSGLVASEQGPIALLNTHASTEVTSSAEVNKPLMAIIRSHKGIIAVETAHIVEHVESPINDDRPKLQDQLAAALDALSQAHLRESTPPQAAFQARTESQTFLRVRSGGVDFAVPAERVHLLDRHRQALPVSQGQTLDWIVKLGDDLIFAQSLSALLNLEKTAQTEPWCLCLYEPSESRGLLVEQVIGLLTVDTAQIKVFNRQEGDSVWLMLSDEHPIKVLSDTPKPSEGAAFIPLERSPNSWTDQQPSAINQQSRVLSLTVGPYQIAITQSMVRSVIGTLEGTRIDTKRGRAKCPVVDLARLFDLNLQITPCFAVTVKLGRKDVVLLCEKAEFSQNRERFWPLPAVPHPINDFFHSVRLIKDRCELLLRNPEPDHEWKHWARTLPQCAYMGWLSTDRHF